MGRSEGSHRSKDISQEEARKLGLFNTIVGHVGDGNFHETIFFDPNNDSQTNAVMDCVRKMMDRAIAMEGTVSGEHAIGLGKKVPCPLSSLSIYAQSWVC